MLDLRKWSSAGPYLRKWSYAGPSHSRDDEHGLVLHFFEYMNKHFANLISAETKYSPPTGEESNRQNEDFYRGMQDL